MKVTKELLKGFGFIGYNDDDDDEVFTLTIKPLFVKLCPCLLIYF